MGRRSSRSSSPMRSRPAPSRSAAPARAASRAAPPAPRKAPTPAPGAPAAPAPAPSQPGMMSQIASTAGGVALGHVAAHGIMNAMGMGHGGSSDAQAPEAPAAGAAPPAGQWEGETHNPCAEQMKAFLQCANSQSDMSLCTAFNDAYKDCKIQYGLQ
eukprot:m.160626 g.160626  ORF g.160626 m.160626 type:complete len:157 (-) comp11970_c0_seq1:227-697(-)